MVILAVLSTPAATWPLSYVIYTATIPSALTGADVAIFASAFAYISDVTTVKDRTIRVTILDVCYLSTMPTGVALGKPATDCEDIFYCGDKAEPLFGH